MKKIALLPDSVRKELFTATALRIGIRPEAAEKYFWVCYMLDHLFHDCSYKDLFVFKGGTSLSKSYHLIRRFSEDIDLVLDWRSLIKDNSDPWAQRSRSSQERYNKMINAEAAEFYVSRLMPALNSELEEELKQRNLIKIDPDDEMVINFFYPRLFDQSYLLPTIRLEIGPLAEWAPSHQTTIQPFAAEQYPHLFEKTTTDILTVDAERTFWEKVTILHKLAHYPEGKNLPPRYARHLYDVYCMGHSPVKQSAFSRKELLNQDILFNRKFYYSKSAHYESATLSEIVLVPNRSILPALRSDYKAMENMIYGIVPVFDEVLNYLSELQDEIHSL